MINAKKLIETGLSPAIIEAWAAVVNRVATRLRNINPKIPVKPPTIRLFVVFELKSDLIETPLDNSNNVKSNAAIEYLKNPIVIGDAIDVRILIATQLAPQKNIETTSAT